MKTALPMIALISLAAPVASPATAGSHVETQSIEVTYDDLNLASKKGQQILQRRIRHAAEKVCATRARTTGSRIRDKAGADCYRTAMTKAMDRYALLIDDRRLGG